MGCGVDPEVGVPWSRVTAWKLLLFSGRADNGSLNLFMGGRPLVFAPAEELPLLQAEDTTLAPWRRVSLALDGVMADMGSDGSPQNEPLEAGVKAECG